MACELLPPGCSAPWAEMRADRERAIPREPDGCKLGDFSVGCAPGAASCNPGLTVLTEII